MEKTGQDTELEVGNRGELTIWVDGTKVAGKGPDGFPSSEQVVQAVTTALG